METIILSVYILCTLSAFPVISIGTNQRRFDTIKNMYDSYNNGYNFDSQMRITLINKNLKIKEIPIKTFYRDEHSSYHVKYSSNFVKELLIYR